MNQEAGVPVGVDRTHPHIAIVTLDRPEKKNAINGEMTALLEKASLELEADDDIWAVVLTSSSQSVFCAGADLAEIAAGRQASLVTEAGGFAGFVRHPKSKPWIVAMDGHALAGGLEMALSCHIRVAADGIKLGLPEPKYGMIAGAGGVDRLPRLIPRAVAIEMLCGGEPIDARRAYEVGLVNHVVAKGSATSKAIAIAQSICTGAPLAVKASLRFAYLADELPATQLLEQMTQVQQRIYQSEDFKEGVNAFAEKRKPSWQGK